VLGDQICSRRYTFSGFLPPLHTARQILQLDTLQEYVFSFFAGFFKSFRFFFFSHAKRFRHFRRFPPFPPAFAVTSTRPPALHPCMTHPSTSMFLHQLISLFPPSFFLSQRLDNTIFSVISCTSVLFLPRDFPPPTPFPSYQDT